MVISVNQLSIYGAVADMIEGLPVGQRAVENRFEKLSEDEKLSRLCSEAGLKSVEIGQFFHALPSPRGEGSQSLCRKIRSVEIKKEVVSKGGSKAMYDLAPSRTYEFAITTEDTVLKFRFNLCFKIKPYLGFEF